MNFGEPIRCCCFWRVAGKDIAFSLSPNFDRQYIIRNSTQKKKWGTEENTGNGRFPLVRGFPFCIEVFIADQELMVIEINSYWELLYYLYVFSHVEYAYFIIKSI